MTWCPRSKHLVQDLWSYARLRDNGVEGGAKDNSNSAQATSWVGVGGSLNSTKAGHCRKGVDIGISFVRKRSRQLSSAKFSILCFHLIHLAQLRFSHSFKWQNGEEDSMTQAKMCFK